MLHPQTWSSPRGGGSPVSMFSSYSSSPTYNGDEDNSQSMVSNSPEPKMRKKDREIRKKEQNKNAATRYRQRKKVEMENVLNEEQQLTQRNEKLKRVLAEHQREAKHLKTRIKELYKNNKRTAKKPTLENKASTSKRAKITFNEEERKKLLAGVKEFPCIWYKQRKDHSNRNVLTSAWYKISEIVGKPEESCKAAWKSLRDSKRYYANKAKKSGSSCDLEDYDFASEVAEFEYSEDMSFLNETSSQRLTFSSMDSGRAVTNSEEILSSLGYNYMPWLSTSQKRSNSSNAALMQSSADKIVEQMGNIVELRKAEMAQKSRFEPLLKHLESLLEQLPQSTANILGAKFTQMAYEEIAKHKKSTSYTNRNEIQ